MDFSVIVCTYNPDPSRLERVLNALKAQDYSGTSEVILVDNNSEKPIRDLAFIRDMASLICIEEKVQGLAQARITGLRWSRGNTIVFVDDDNLLAPDYLTQLKNVQDRFPPAGVFGPGIVELEYETRPPIWIKTHFGAMFQEKTHTADRFGKEKAWPDYYPAGSGMCVKRQILETYAQQFTAGKLSAAGRQGRTLSSGEDAQIVWTGIKMGFEAGTSPDLQLKHIIPASRLSLRYLAQLQFQLGRSYCLAMAEMFPENKRKLRPLSWAGHIRLILQELNQSRFMPLLFYRKYKISLAWFRGVKDANITL